MKTPRRVFAALLTTVALVGTCQLARSEVITMAASYSYPTNIYYPDFTNEPLTVPAGHTAHVLFTSTLVSDDGKFYFTREGDVTQFPLRLNGYVTGPGVIHLDPKQNFQGTFSPWATVQVEPATYPPGKTMILGEGTNTAAIALACSTNLDFWTACTNGFYGGSNTAMFFRIQGSVIANP